MTTPAAARPARASPEPDTAPRVLLLADDLQVGGVARVVLDIALALLDADRPVGLAAGATGGMWNLVPDRCATHPFPDGNGPLTFAKRLTALRALATSGQYDIIHAHQRGVALAARIAVTGTPVTVVEHVHNVFPAGAIARLLSFRGHLLVACGTAVATMLADDYGRPASRINVVLNGIRDHGASARRATPRTDDTPIRVIGVGRLTEQKDPQRFVRAIAALTAATPKRTVQATWYGDGPLRADTEQLVTELGLTDIIDLPGNVDDPTSAYNQADLLLLTSRFEGLPLVALEALAAGCAIVVPDVGSCADAFGGEHIGTLYPAGASDAELARILTDELHPQRITTTAQNARTRYLTAFTLERMIGSVFEIYEAARMVKKRP